MSTLLAWQALLAVTVVSNVECPNIQVALLAQA